MRPARALSPQLPLDDAIAAATQRLWSHQGDNGAWPGEYTGPLFLLPTYVAIARVVGLPLDAATRRGMARYLKSQQNDDGGFGLHVGGPSLVYTTTLAYVALRLLGEAPTRPSLRRALAWLERQGGVTGAAPWGKFTLALLGLYSYDGLPPVPPELWMLPKSLPIHPSRYWCHARLVYLPMSYFYGTRAAIDDADDLAAIRSELYPEGYDNVAWPQMRYRLAPSDAFTPISKVYQAASDILSLLEPRANPTLRKRALDFTLAQIRREDENTNYICLGPVNKLYNTAVWHFARPKGQEVGRHLAQLPDYLWRNERGVNMSGYNSSQLWDTCFAVQALNAAEALDGEIASAQAARNFIAANQIRRDPPERRRAFRHRTRGGWPFSDAAQGWPTSDCTAVGIEAALTLNPLTATPIEPENFESAVDYILSLQNRDGGWPTYEPARASAWLEKLNPAAVFGDIMIDYSYPECTSACIQALTAARGRLRGAKRPRQSDRAIAAGLDYLLATQHEDGSWYGSWGICFTYATWFGVWGLLAGGIRADAEPIQRACRFLFDRQLPDGGWGETMDSCRTETYCHAESGQATMTSWALLTLVRAGQTQSSAVQRGVEFLLARQQDDGSWPAENIAGVFNKTCAIHYDNYLKVFPLWALGEYRRAQHARTKGH